eukprot:sb/3479666/
MADGFSRLQILQSRKFLFSVKQGDSAQVEKLCLRGVPDIVNTIVEPEGECGIHAAVKKADTDMILKLLDLGASIDRRDSVGRTPLMIAVDYGYDHLLDTLLDNGAKFDATDQNGNCVVWYALKPTKRHLNCLEKLCKMGQDVNATDKSGESLLMGCYEDGLTTRTEVVLGYEINLETTNAVGVQAETPNYSALTPRTIAHQNKDKVMKRLLRRYQERSDAIVIPYKRYERARTLNHSQIIGLTP